MRLVVTGGGGFIGRSLARAMVGRGHTVFAVDDLSAAGSSPDADGWEVVRADVSAPGAAVRILGELGADRVLHAAAVAGVHDAAEDPLPAVETNVLGTARVVDAAARHGVARLVAISSDEVYAGAAYEPVDEDHPTVPTSVYGATKLAAEIVGRTLASGRLELVHARLCWVYGPGFPRERLPRTMLLDALRGRSTSLPSGRDHRLDLTYVDDAVDGLVRLLEAGELRHDTYNVSSGRAWTVGQVAAAIERLVPSWRWSIGPGLLALTDGVALPRKAALDISRMRELGYRPRWSLADGLAAELEGLRE